MSLWLHTFPEGSSQASGVGRLDTQVVRPEEGNVVFSALYPVPTSMLGVVNTTGYRFELRLMDHGPPLLDVEGRARQWREQGAVTGIQAVFEAREEE